MNNKFDKMGEYNQNRSAKQNAQIMTIHKTMTNLVMDNCRRSFILVNNNLFIFFNLVSTFSNKFQCH